MSQKRTQKRQYFGQSKHATGLRAVRANPEFDFYIVLDFEATCCDTDRAFATGKKPAFPREHMEVIEFPSVLVDVRPMREGKPPKIVDEYQAYVQPVLHPHLTEFCTKLTGITQETVDAGVSFRDAFRGHQKWLHGHGIDLRKPGTQAAILTCGDWDLKTELPQQLLHELHLHGTKLPYPTLYRQWINVQRVFKARHRGFRGGMMRMLEHLQIPHTGRHHSGIDDCRNTAKILVRLLEQGSPVKLTGQLEQNWHQNRSHVHGVQRGKPAAAKVPVRIKPVCKYDGTCHTQNPQHWKRTIHHKQNKPLARPQAF